MLRAPIPQHRSSELTWARTDSARLSGHTHTQRRIGAPFTRTSQAFARFNPEIRTGVAELLEHSVRRPRPRVRRVVVNPLPHRTLSGNRSPANRRTPARHRGCGDSWLPLQRPCIRGLACYWPHAPHTAYHKPNARETIWVGRACPNSNKCMDR